MRGFIGILCIGISAAVILHSVRLNAGKLSPSAIYSGAWLGGIGLHLLGPVRYDQVSSRAWLVMLSAMLAFAWGSAMGSWTSSQGATRTPVLLCRGRLWRAIKLFAAAGVVSSGYMVGRILLQRGFSFGRYAAIAQSEFYVTGLGYVHLLNALVPSLCIVYLVGFREDRRHRRWSVAIIGGLCCVLLLLTGKRNSFMAALGSAGLAYLTAKDGPTWREGAVLATAVLLVFTGLAPFRLPNYSAMLRRVTMYRYGLLPRCWAKPPLSYLLQPYGYWTANFVAFSRFIEHVEGLDWGWNSFGLLFLPVQKVIGLRVSPPPLHYSGVVTPFYVNTYTYLRELYADFGLAGCLLAPAGLGFTATVLFQVARRQTRFAAASGFMSWFVALSVRSNQLRYLGSWWLFFLALGVGIYSCGAGRPGRLSEGPTSSHSGRGADSCD
jgi:hypothetical protein